MGDTTIKLSTGSILVTNRTITFQANNKLISNQSIERSYIGGINYREFIYTRLSPFNYGARLFVGGGAVAILCLVVYAITDSIFFNSIYWVSVFLCIVGAAINLFEFFIDALFGTNIAKDICDKLFGIKGYEVSIQNTSGGDHVVFNIMLADLEKVKDLIKFKINNENARGELGNTLKELNELLELKKSDVITDDEFNKLKNLKL